MEMTHLLKAFFVTALMRAATVTAYSCPNVDDPERVVVFPDIYDCGSYFLCREGLAVHMECPSGQHFSELFLRCEHPETAGCVPPSPRPDLPQEPNVKPQPLPKPPSPSVSRTCPPPGPGPLVLYPHPNDCSKFQVCINGYLVDMDCPTGLHFNPSLKVCDTPIKAGCKINTTHHHSHYVVSIIGFLSLFLSNICPPPGEGELILFPHPRNCSEYIICDNGNLSVMSCPEGTHFNPESKVCDFPSEAGCQNASKWKSVFVSRAGDGSKACPPAGEGSLVVLPDPKNCSQFLMCDNGELVIRPCPPGLEFNPVAKVCDHPSLAGCTVSRKSFSPPTSYGSSVCPPPGEGDLILLPDYKNCSQYIVCDNGDMTTLPCPPGLHFSANLQVCVLPLEAGCATATRRRIR